MATRPLRLPAADFHTKALSSTLGQSLPEIADVVEFINRNEIKLI